MPELTSRETLLAATELTSAYISVPEWDDARVKVRAWSGKERDRFDSETGRILKSGADTLETLRARVVAHALVNEDGSQMFLVGENGKQSIDPAAVEALGQKDAAGLYRVYKVASKLNHLTVVEDEEDDEGN